MKRHEAMRALSREHHRALVIAREAKRGRAGADVLTAFARDELRRHFGEEEEALLPALVEAGESALAERTRREHDALRALAAAIEIAATDATCVAFAMMLEAHVRFEERELFRRAEAVLGEETLARIASHRDRQGD